MSNVIAISAIVVGTDFTPCSAVALRQATRIAAWSGAKIHVVHVIDTTVVIELETALSPMQQGIRDSLVNDAERAWADFAKNIPGAAGLPIEVAINNRIVGILRRAREYNADRHHAHLLPRVLQGSFVHQGHLAGGRHRAGRQDRG